MSSQTLATPPPEDEGSHLDPAHRSKKHWSYFWSYKALFAAGAVFLLLTNILSFASPGYLGQAIDLMRQASLDGGMDFASVRSEVIAAAIAIILSRQRDQARVPASPSAEAPGVGGRKPDNRKNRSSQA